MEWGAQRLDLSLPVPFAHSPWVGERAYLIALRTALLDDSMPPAAYLLLHPLHSLSSAEREAILGWVDAALERLEPGSAERDGDLSLAERTAGVLRDRCARCHNPDVDDEMNGEFDFVADLPFLVDDGEYVEPEDVEASKLWERIASREEPMPPSPNDRLDRAEKALVREWIEEGAPVDELRR
jgi:mono/diheme cytochrome c family protein